MRSGAYGSFRQGRDHGPVQVMTSEVSRVSSAAVPEDEEARLAALAEYEMLDTEPEQRFDRLVDLVSKLLDVPVAALSLVDRDRQWFKARVGTGLAETSRDDAFCAHTILDRDVFVVEDAQADPRFVDNRLVSDHNVRFYAGAPILSREGSAVAVLCAIDDRPRTLEPAKLAILRELAAVAADEMELRLKGRLLQRSEQRLRSLASTASDWIWETDTEHRIAFHSSLGPALEQLGDVIGRTRWELAGDSPNAEKWRGFRAMLDAREPFRGFRYDIRKKDGGVVHLEISGEPVFDADGTFAGYRGCGTDITPRVEAEIARRSLSDRLEALERADVVGIITGQGTLIEYANDEFLRIVGRSRDEIESGTLRWSSLTPPGWETVDANLIDEMLAMGRSRPIEKEYARPDGTRMPVMLTTVLLDRDSFRWQALVQDIGERKRAEARMERLGRRLQALEAANVVGICTGEDLRILSANDEYLRIIGRSRLELERGELTVRAVTSRSAFKADRRMRRQVQRYGYCHTFETRARRPDGSELPVLVTTILVDREQRLWQSLVQDISERKAQEARIAQLAFSDVLTGLSNRRHFNDELAAILARGEAGALIFVDLDHFKDVNDALGHDAGDALLREIASRLKTSARADDLVARIGGDEFAIVLKGEQTTRAVSTIAERITQALQMPVHFGGHEIHPGGSLGITRFPHDGQALDKLLKNADVALYRSKATGRRTFRFFEREMEADALARLELAGEIRKSLETGAFVPAFQPVFSLENDRLRGFEALLRWHHPVRGLLTPDAFLKVAEDAGLVPALGQVMIEATMERCGAWYRGKGRTGVIAINAAVEQFKDGTYTERLLHAAATHGVPISDIEIEINENVLLSDDRRVEGTIHALHDIGARIALDDFGTGVASLTHLKRFPVDVLKIDRSFVREIDTDPESAVIARAIVNLAHSLRLEVVAEGIETEAQRDALRLLGCDFGQGYLYAKPGTAEEVADWLDDDIAAPTHKRQASKPPPCSRG